MYNNAIAHKGVRVCASGILTRSVELLHIGFLWGCSITLVEPAHRRPIRAERGSPTVN